jgi:hypothetical protein
MRTRRIVLSLVSLVAVLAAFMISLPAHAAADCGGGWVDGAGTTNQYIGCQGEDTNQSGSQYFGDCYGQCGRGCSWYNCGSGGCCQTHDYYTRTQGLWSGAAMSYFPCAIVQWGGCVTGRGSRAAGAWIYSKTLGAWGQSGSMVN